METKEIIENNKLIALFMGYGSEPYFLPQFRVLTSQYGLCDFNEHFNNNELKFYTSWDWLMPVVEKIEDIRIEPDSDMICSYHRFTVAMPCAQCEIFDTLTKKTVGFGDNSTKLLSTFDAVIEFIKWHNLNK